MHLYGVPHAHERFIENVKGDCHQRKRIDKGRQNTGPMIAKGLGSAGRAGLNEDCDPGEQQSQQVCYVMPRFRKQCQAMRPYSSKKGDQDIGKSGRKGITQSLGAQRCVRMSVPMAHTLRVYAECGLIGANLLDENLNTYIRTPMLNMSIRLELRFSCSPKFSTK